MATDEKIVKLAPKAPSAWKHKLGVSIGLSVVFALFLAFISLTAVVVRFAYNYVTAACS